MLFYEQLQYHLESRTFKKDQEMIKYGQECKEIIFIVDGLIEIEVHNSKGECCVLDILKQGDVIGQYAILTKTGYKFDANALTDGKIFTLSEAFLLKNKEKIEGLSQALQFANELVSEDGVPIQDYRIH